MFKSNLERKICLLKACYPIQKTLESCFFSEAMKGLDLLDNHLVLAERNHLSSALSNVQSKMEVANEDCTFWEHNGYGFSCSSTSIDCEVFRVESKPETAAKVINTLWEVPIIIFLLMAGIHERYRGETT